MSDILLITPPFTQLNTPYPATAYIKGFLNTKEIDSQHMDLGIEVILKMFSRAGLKEIFNQVVEPTSVYSENSSRIMALQEAYIGSIDLVIRFLQGKQQTLARQICSPNFLPRASRFQQLDELDWAFGDMGMQDKAKHLATLYLEDISDFIVECVDADFGFSRYAERIARSANSFDELYNKLQGSTSYIDEITIDILKHKIEATAPKLVCFSIPFPGNLYSAFRCSQYIKAHFPNIKIAFGGGFPNTELRSVTDVRVFEFVDYISLDDGELPLEIIISNLLDESPENPNHNLYKRTFLLENGQIVYNNFSLRKDYRHEDVGTPDYSDLLLDQYISVIEIANPMHSLWSDGRWNKLTMAHGCYWGKCTFCDISLDYIANYQPIAAKILVDRMETLIEQTGETGFHFVDEAAPPALMREVALEILRRNLVVSWWTNIRFEKSFTFGLCQLLKASGCIAISGGLEVASDRLLALIKKGVTVEQVAQVTRNFTESGIMVHAYLMYGYPTQTVQETVDSLEMVRQLFEASCLRSGFWHQFALTAHSPVGLDPDAYGIVPQKQLISFADNDVDFIDRTGIDHGKFSYGLKKSLFNYMHDMCFDMGLGEWFDFEIPATTIASDYIESCLHNQEIQQIKPTSKMIFIGSGATLKKGKSSRGKQIGKLTIHGLEDSTVLEMDVNTAVWMHKMIGKISARSGTVIRYQEMKADYETQFDDFTLFWYSDEMELWRANGLIIL